MERPTRATRATLTTSATEFAEVAAPVVATAAGGGPPVSLFVVRLDANDTAAPKENGHGSAVREQLVELIRRNLRGSDVVAFTSPEEIVVLLPGASADEGRYIAQRLCAATRNHAFAGNAGDRLRTGLTTSIGVATAPAHGSDVYGLAGDARTACESLATNGGDGVAGVDAAAGRAAGILEIGRFVGRTEEVASIRRWMDDAMTGMPRAVAVLGEAGSGREALVRQLEPEVRLRGGSLIVARARNAEVRTPYGIWTEVLNALQRLPDAPTKTWRELMHLHPGIPGSEEERAGSKFRLLEEISEYVRLAARARPLVLLLDEMQWSDAASWDVLDHLLTQLERERLLLCMTVRDGPEQSETATRRQSLERIGSYHEIRLSRLTRDEAKRWLEAAMQRQQIGRELLAYLYRHTEGNPLFMVQLVRNMLEEGYLRHTGDKWEWSPVSELRLPNGLDEIIERRLRRLSPPTQQVLATAAVIGRQFDVTTLQAAAGVAPGEVQRALEEALAVALIQPHYERGGGGYRFAHGRVAEAFAASIPVEQLSRTHERVARALSGLPHSATEATLHFDRAGCASDAYQAALEAAVHAESIYSSDTAGEFLQIAARNATSPGELAEVRVRLAHLAETFGRFDEAEELCDLAIEWFSGQGDRLRALTLRRMRERARRELGQPARVTLDALRALDDEAKELDSDQERIEILTMESQTYARLGDPQRAEQLAEECVAMAERVDDPALLAAALNRFAITVRNEDPARARTYFERALALFQGLGDVRGQARCHNNLGIVAQLEMRPDYGRESLTMAMTLARAAGMPDLSGIAAANLGVIMQRMGDADRAKQLYGDALALFAAVKNSELQLYALYNMANLERETGNFASGAELYEATSSLAQRIGQSDVEIGAMAGEGICLHSLDKMDAAQVQLSEIEARMSNRTGWFQGRELVDALRVRIAIAEGRIADAMAVFESARATAEGYDMYSVAWLTAACADLLLPHYPDQVLAAVEKYSGQVASLGFTDLIRKYKLLQNLPPETAPT
ncbi:MAG: AAA family ATPase [Gemmatimonadaceae bacterium]